MRSPTTSCRAIASPTHREGVVTPKLLAGARCAPTRPCIPTPGAGFFSRSRQNLNRLAGSQGDGHRIVGRQTPRKRDRTMDNPSPFTPALETALKHALHHLDGAAHRPVNAPTPLDPLRARLGRPLADHGVDPAQVID